MKIMLFIMLNLAALVAQADEILSGVLIKDAGNVYLSSDSACGRYKILTSSAEVSDGLRKLSHGDALTALGAINMPLCTVEIQSIDYVGLRRLLGYWHTDVGMITVKDFNSLMIYPKALAGTNESGQRNQVPEPIVYHYSMLPSAGKEWVMFLSDTTTTTFATLIFHKSSATLKTFDSNNGILKSELHMIRWKQLK